MTSETTELKIGKWTLRPVTVRTGDKPPYDAINIEHESGEGMSTPIENIEALIAQFYWENF